MVAGMTKRVWRWGAVVLATAMVAGPAQGELQTLEGQRWQSTPDKYGVGRTHAGRLLGHLELDANIWTDYERNPLVLRDTTKSALPDFVPQRDSLPFKRRSAGLVGQRLASEVTFAMGLFNWVQVFGALPVSLFQERGEGISQSGVRTSQLNQFNLGDIRLGAKIRILRAEEQFVDLALIPQLTVPVGLGFSLFAFDRVGPGPGFPVPRPEPGFGGFAQGYNSEGFFTLQPEMALSRELWGFFGAGNVGLRLRRPYALASTTVSQEFLLRGALGFRGRGLEKKLWWMKYLPVELGIEGTAAANLPHPYLTVPYITPNSDTSAPKGVLPNLLQAYGLSGEVGALAGLDLFWVHPYAGVSVGVLPGWGTPDWRAMAGVRVSTEFGSLLWDKPPPRKPVAAPLAPPSDRDGDGIVDDQDQCPDEPGLPEFKGCPPPQPVDTDGDGLLDPDDQCPRQPEDVDGHEDQDGCPDPDNDGDGLNDDVDVCPNEPETRNGWMDQDGCPDAASPEEEAARTSLANLAADRDGDGVSDVQDACPADAEDKDGFEDGDGCPDPDNDQDGFADGLDKCPLEPEIVNERDDEDGCPDRGRSLVVLTREKIEIRDKIYFATNKARIQKRSYGLLNQIASVFNTHPELHVSIEGHTDDRGKDEYNLKLSQTRADSVREYLIGRKVAPERLRSVGYGETRPAMPNTSARNREANRRVEFVILDPNAQQQPKPPPAGTEAQPQPTDTPPSTTP